MEIPSPEYRADAPAQKRVNRNRARIFSFLVSLPILACEPDELTTGICHEESADSPLICEAIGARRGCGRHRSFQHPQRRERRRKGSLRPDRLRRERGRGPPLRGAETQTRATPWGG